VGSVDIKLPLANELFFITSASLSKLKVTMLSFGFNWFLFRASLNEEITFFNRLPCSNIFKLGS
jgi:hypothetical protein